MPAYLFVHSTIHDPARFDEYRAASAPSVEQFGGRLLVAGAVVESLEGNHAHRRAVVFEFPNTDAVRRWYASSEYRAVMQLRAGTGEFAFILVESF